MTPPLPRIGWIVLTEQPDGTWLPDWDGLLHVDEAAAEAAYAEAIEDLRPEFVRLAEVHGVTRAGLPWSHPDSDPMGDLREVAEVGRSQAERPPCPVCGTTPWADKIEVGTSADAPPYPTIDGTLHCPNDDRQDHVDYWRERRSHRWAAGGIIP